ncbi:MAG: hypothetical protein M4D80_16845 [Myxococcota bacterium]|nr:hypothetical protein [Myxococcota bacterium]
MKLLLLFLVACGSTQRVLPDDKRCTEDKLRAFSRQLGVEQPTFDVEAPAGSEAGRRYAEFSVTREQDKIREVAERANMEIELSGLEGGVLVRATCK